MENNQGLNGFWGWLKRNVHGIAAVCTAIGLAPIAFALEAIVGASGSGGAGSGGAYGGMGDDNMYKMEDYEPTTSEASILDFWVDKKLTPFYTSLLNQIKSAFANTNHDFQLQAINDAIMKMCVVRTYYTNHDIVGLSPSAINLRMKLIDTIFQPIEDMIPDSIANDTSVHLSTYTLNGFDTGQFLPLILQSISANCNKYESNNSGSQNTPLLTTTPVVVNPVTNQVISSPTTAKNNSNSNTAIVLLSLLGLVVLFYPSEKKKKT